MERYYALVENEQIVYLGEFDSMEDADNSSDKMIIWILTYESLLSIYSTVLPLLDRVDTRQSIDIPITECDIESFKELVYQEEIFDWEFVSDTNQLITVNFETSDGETDDAE